MSARHVRDLTTHPDRGCIHDHRKPIAGHAVVVQDQRPLNLRQRHLCREQDGAAVAHPQAGTIVECRL